MISEADIMLLHEFSTRDFGGAKEIRDRAQLLSAIARPFQTFDGKELYPTIFEKAAALGESLIINHPFIDGNKRTTLLTMISLLEEYGEDFSGNDNEVYHLLFPCQRGKVNLMRLLHGWKQGADN